MTAGHHPRARPPGAAALWMPVAAVLLVAGSVGLGELLHGNLASRQSGTGRQLQSKPLDLPPSAAIPIGPTSVAFVQTRAMSFSSTSDGWVLGSGCDAALHCSLATARTTDGGASWSLTHDPTAAANAELRIASSSSRDAWVWGSGATGSAELLDTHDGGSTWHLVQLPGAVSDVSVASGTVWARTDCAGSAASSCTAAIYQSPTTDDGWSRLGSLPADVADPPVVPEAPGASVIRSPNRAWVIGSDSTQNVIVRSDDHGHTWVPLAAPCSTHAEMYMAAASENIVMLACTQVGGLPSPQEVWSSTDGGQSWTLDARQGVGEAGASTPDPLPDVGHIGSSGYPTGLALGQSGVAWMTQGREDVLVSRDGGRSWAHAPLPPSYFGQAGGAGGLEFADPMHGWTFAAHGLWATVDGGATWVYQPVIGPVIGY